MQSRIVQGSNMTVQHDYYLDGSHKGEPVFRLSVLRFSFSPGSYRYGYQVLPDSEISFELPHEAA